MLQHRFTSQLALIRARVASTSYFGLQLTLGALVIVMTGWLFGKIAEDVVTGAPLTIIDAQVAAWFHGHTVPALTVWMLGFTDLHSVAGIALLALTLALWLSWKGERYWLIVVAFVVPGGMLLNVLTKFIFQRARPSFIDPILTLDSYSFPSGHVSAATLFYGVLAAFLVMRIAPLRGRVLIALTAIFLVTLVALTRIYLGAHYLSDVLAAFAQSVAWTALCLTALHTLQHRRNLPQRTH